MDYKLKEAIIKGKAGDIEALTEIYNKTQHMVYFTALKLIQSESDAQDIVQDTYIKAFQNLDKLQNEEAFLGWLKTIVVNLSKNYLKRRKPLLFETREKEEWEFANIPEISEDFLPAEYADRKEKCRMIMDIVDRLPDLQRTAVILYYFNELSIREVAEIMETSDGTIKSRLNYARKQIKQEVEEEEKKGTKLYSVSAAPILTRILQNASQDYTMPAAISADIISASLRASAGSTGSGAAGRARVDVGRASGKAASNNIISKFMTASLSTKIIAGVVAASLAIGGGIGIGRMINREASGNRLSNSINAPENREWEELLGKTKEEIVALLGEPEAEDTDKKEFYYGVYYNDGEVILASLKIYFHDDNTVSLISCEEDSYSVQGVKKGYTLAQVKSIFDALPDASLEGENVDCGVLSAIFYRIGDCSYQFLYDEEEVVDHIAISLIRHETVVMGGDTATDTDSEEPVKDDEPQSQAQENEPQPQKQEEEQKPQVHKDEAEIKSTYKEYFLKNFKGKNAQAFLADLTHDGIQEMIVVYGDDMEGYLEVYSIQNGAIKLIYDDYAATTTNMQYAYGLYEESGKYYLFTYAFFERQGYPWYFYEIYSLTGDGKAVQFKGKSIEFEINEKGNYVGTTKQEIDQLNQETKNYALKSKLLMSGTGYYGMDNPSLDMMYGKGEAFADSKPAEPTTGGSSSQNGKSSSQTENPAVGRIAIDKLMLTDEQTIIAKLGSPKPNNVNYWKMTYDGLEVFSNYGGVDTFLINKDGYSVHGVFVGQSKGDALKALEGTKAMVIDGYTYYIFRDKDINGNFEFAIVPSFEGDRVSQIYYQVHFD